MVGPGKTTVTITWNGWMRSAHPNVLEVVSRRQRLEGHRGPKTATGDRGLCNNCSDGSSPCDRWKKDRDGTGQSLLFGLCSR